MPTKFTGRILLILAILFLSLISIFPPQSLFDSSVPWSQKLGLKPGIDMAGGVSLIYEIKVPDSPGGSAQGANLADQVMEALKKRVDPDGVRNLIWRPQGGNRLEIQMPTSKTAGVSAERRKAYAAAQQAIEATNVRTGDVIRAVEKLTGDARRDRLNKLAADSGARQKLFPALASTFDRIKDAQAKKDASAQAAAEIEYENLKTQIDDTNLPARSLEDSVSQGGVTRQTKLDELKKKYADFPSRLTAIDTFVKTYDDFSQVKSSLDDAEDLKRLLRGSGVLEFHILVDNPRANTAPEVQEMIDRLHKSGPVVKGGDTMRWYPVDNPDEFRGQTILDANGKPYVLAYTTPDKSMDNKGGRPAWALAKASPNRDTQSSHRIVSFEFDAQGGKYFGDLTGNNIGKALGIVLDDRMISAPNVRTQINGGGQISGNEAEGGFSEKEQSYLVSMLSAGSLPARLTDEPISEKAISPLIGADNLKYGLIACGVGLVIVVIFLISYYYLAGVVASFAVLLNVVIILGVMAMFKATFTLPGVAGIVLTIGAAVDANVLIFERLREEQHRGLSLRMALRNAYDRAFSAIVDSNATTVFTSLFLYWFGSEEVKGFGLTLLIGLLSSLFTALYVTKTIFAILVDRFGITDLSSLPRTFPKWDKLLKPDIDWMKLVPIFCTISVVLTVVGLTAFIQKTYQREMADIEFASGTSVQFELKKPMEIEDVRKLLASPEVEKDLPSPAVVQIGGPSEYEVVTPSDRPTVKEAVLKAMGDRLKIELPSKFQGTGLPVDDAMSDKVVVPITNADFSVDGFSPPDAANYVGGAAIILRNLDPALSPAEIRTRIERQRLLPQAQGSQPTYRDYVVNADVAKGTDPTKLAVILTGDPNLPYDKDRFKWKDEIAGPMWKLVNEAVNKPASLSKVTSFNPQVAGDAQRDALLALTLSIVAIMGYIWLRFGNMKYATATVVAMIHDTLLVIAFLGLAHWISQYTPGLAKVLMVEPFRINLTIVAAVLTVMSYSMIDTIVVFDRVRENRGKYGHLSRKIINDSVNQTLSRTLLTGGTNMMTVFVMYVMGGPGIHGFTFVLVTGILVGTYSSVAIAAPILLIGKDKGDKNTPRGGDNAGERAGGGPPSGPKEESRKALTSAGGQLQPAGVSRTS